MLKGIIIKKDGEKLKLTMTTPDNEFPRYMMKLFVELLCSYARDIDFNYITLYKDKRAFLFRIYLTKDEKYYMAQWAVGSSHEFSVFTRKNDALKRFSSMY